MSHPDGAAGSAPEPGEQAADQDRGPTGTPAGPVQPEYLMALEAPDPTPGLLPTQPTGAHDADSAPVPAAPVDQPPPAARHRRTGLVVMSIVAVLLLAAGGVLGYLWWDDHRGLVAGHEAEVAELTGQLAEQDQEISRLEDDLQRAGDDLAATEQALEGTQNKLELVEEEQGVIRRCFALHAEVLEAAIVGDQAAYDAVVDEWEEVCAEADQILAN